LDQAGWPIGSLSSLWARKESVRIQLLGIRTTWAAAQWLLVPAEGVQVDRSLNLAWVPYFRDYVHDAVAPTVSGELTLEQEREIYLHYGLQVSGTKLRIVWDGFHTMRR
jgi:hypothetical protein